jgi:hypothetical protein
MTTTMGESIGKMTMMGIGTAIAATATSASVKSIYVKFEAITTSASCRPDSRGNTIGAENFRGDGIEESSPFLMRWSEACRPYLSDTREATWMAMQSCTSREHTW